MAKVRLVLYKRPNVGWDEFRAYWSENHAALIASIPGVRRYVHHQLALGGRPSDNVAELWFDSHEAMRAAIGSRPSIAVTAPRRLRHTALSSCSACTNVISPPSVST